MYLLGNNYYYNFSMFFCDEDFVNNSFLLYDLLKIGIICRKYLGYYIIPVFVGLLSLTRNASRACLLSKNYLLNKNAIRLLETFQKLFQLKLKLFLIFNGQILHVNEFYGGCNVEYLVHFYFKTEFFGISAIAIFLLQSSDQENCRFDSHC